MVESDLDIPLYNIHLEILVPSSIRLLDINMDHGNIRVKGVASVGRCNMDNGLMVLEGVGTVGNLTMDNGDMEVKGSRTIESASLVYGNLQVRLDAIPNTGTELSVDTGDLNIQANEDITMDIDLKVENGHLAVEDFEPVYTTKGSGYLVGSINGGGPKLEARVGNGDLVLKGYGGGI
jgi:DUF4097 and DUF4098 domain-containing protein YvlB